VRKVPVRHSDASQGIEQPIDGRGAFRYAILLGPGYSSTRAIVQETAAESGHSLYDENLVGGAGQ
jgi:hypothetical protein